MTRVIHIDMTEISFLQWKLEYTPDKMHKLCTLFHDFIDNIHRYFALFHGFMDNIHRYFTCSIVVFRWIP